MINSYNKNKDFLTTLMFSENTSRLTLVSLSSSFSPTIENHKHFSPNIIDILNELTVASILLSSTIKHKGAVTLQIHGDGPVSLAIAECRHNLTFRSTIKQNEKYSNVGNLDFQSLINKENKGLFSLILDQKIKNKKPYQGIVSLNKSSLASTVENYLIKSEQISSVLRLFTNKIKTIGILLQLLPDKINSNCYQWNILKNSIKKLTKHNILENDFPLEYIVDLFLAEKPRQVKKKYPSFLCTCNEEKFLKVIEKLGKEEIKKITKNKKFLDAKCEFCNKTFKLSLKKINYLFSF